jgi:hypothetical protein
VGSRSYATAVCKHLDNPRLWKITKHVVEPMHLNRFTSQILLRKKLSSNSRHKENAQNAVLLVCDFESFLVRPVDQQRVISDSRSIRFRLL